MADVLIIRNGVVAMLAVFGRLHAVSSTPAEVRAMDESEHETLRRLYEQTRIVIDGKKDPALVPFAVRMKLFFYRYKRFGKGYQLELKPLLSASDHEVLSQYADLHNDEIRRDQVESATRSREISSRAESMSGLEIAIALETAYQNRQQQWEDRYRGVLQELSPQGRRIVEDFAYQRIRPVSLIHNGVAVAARAPDLYKRAVIEGYSATKDDPIVPTWYPEWLEERAFKAKLSKKQ